MAKENRYILMNADGSNVVSDLDLKSETLWDEKGILQNEIAYSNRMNAILRQVTTISHAWAEIVATKNDGAYGSYPIPTEGVKVIDDNELAKALKVIILEHAENKNAIRSNNHVWATALTGDKKPVFRSLVLADIPTIDTEKIGDKQVTAPKIADKTITNAQIANKTVLETLLNDNAVSTRTIINSAVTNVKLASNAVETAKIKNNAVTMAKLAANMVTGDYISDTVTDPKYRTVIGEDHSGALKDYKIVKLTTAQYNSLGTNRKANTIYLLV